MDWKILLVKFEKVNVELEGKIYNDAINKELSQKIEAAYYHFTGLVKGITSGLINIETEVFNCEEITTLDISKVEKPDGKKTLWARIDSKRLQEKLIKSNKIIKLGEFDSIFAILPFEEKGLNSSYHLLPLADIYDPNTLFAATYSCIPCSLEYWKTDMNKFRGEVFLHEWLHCVCSFFEWAYKFDIPKRNSDAAEDYGYKKVNGSWVNFYADLMNCNINENNVGIPKVAWSRMTPSQFNLHQNSILNPIPSSSQQKKPIVTPIATPQ